MLSVTPAQAAFAAEFLARLLLEVIAALAGAFANAIRAFVRGPTLIYGDIPHL